MNCAEEEKVTYIEARELLELVRENDNISVIDVRTDDFEGGHIADASNIPVDEWEDDDNIEKIIKSHINDKKKDIVFHCMHSQVRGPFCAKRYAAAISRLENSAEELPNVKILRGGYKAWEALSGSLGDDGKDMIKF